MLADVSKLTLISQNGLPVKHQRIDSSIPTTTPGSTDEPRIYGFDLTNENWQGDRDHYGNQRINARAFPRTIRRLVAPDPTRSWRQFWKVVPLSPICGATLESHVLFMTGFLRPNSVYLRFTHVVNMQPKFYVGSATHHTLDYEHSQARKYFQLEHDKLVQAELSLRFWQDRQNLYPWASILIFVRRAGYRCLALNLG